MEWIAYVTSKFTMYNDNQKATSMESMESIAYHNQISTKYYNTALKPYHHARIIPLFLVIPNEAINV